MRTLLLGLITLMTTFVAACGSSPKGEAANMQPDAADVATMTLSQRAALIKTHDPISRVEILLGEPILTSKVATIELLNRMDNVSTSMDGHDRYYAIGSDVVLRVAYYSASAAESHWRKLSASAIQQGPTAVRVLSNTIERIELSGQDAVRNGYADWIVARTRSFQRGLEGDDADVLLAFRLRDNQKRDEKGP